MKHSAFTQGCSMESTDSNWYGHILLAVTIVDAYCIGAARVLYTAIHLLESLSQELYCESVKFK